MIVQDQQCGQQLLHHPKPVQHAYQLYQIISIMLSEWMRDNSHAGMLVDTNVLESYTAIIDVDPAHFQLGMRRVVSNYSECATTLTLYSRL